MKKRSKQSRPAPVVGIGASAGGLEAIEAFFQAMPATSGMAFVVIQHLSPDYKSLMVELLSRKTKIPVQRAENGMPVAPNNIYLIPPRKNLTIFHGKLLLEDQKQHEGINLPVDIFLRSLAEDQGENAVAIILSGTGSDGTRGVRAVKEWGGLVLVQDEASARFDGMPRAAASTGLADFVLPPDEMPTQLLACLRHPYSARQDRDDTTLGNETGLTRLFSLLRSKTRVDFTYYKPSTINRRIDRRIAVTQAADLEAYVRYVEQTPAEVSALYRELLIGVTSFFRDPEIMTKMEQEVLPDLLSRNREQELRCWVAGCSTGEEAYTLAILIHEVLETLGLVRDVKIFATDIDRDAVARAGSGTYPESIAADLRPNLLARYFYRRGDTYQVARTIREMVVFAQHNLVKDPPFTRIDLVSCRNLLIYLQTNLQQRALEMFSFSLRPGGILLLGSSETVGEMTDRFEPLDHKARIYRFQEKIRPAASGRQPVLDKREPAPLPLAVSSGFRSGRFGQREQDRLLSRLLDLLAASTVPLTAVVNQQLEVLHILGDPAGIFSLPSGRAVFDISRMVDRELAIPLTTGLQKVFRNGEELIYNNVRLRAPGKTRSLRLRILPLPGRKNDEPLAAVFFEQVGKATVNEAPSVEYNLDQETGQRLQDLEQELQFTRENLQATIEELETSNEELQATNEELLASNEELQSTNEELQSTNEELYTVNTEYQNKIIELTEARNDVDNLLASFRIGTLILDEDLCIRRFSEPASEVFHLLESDIGRPLHHLTHCLQDFEPVAMAREVQTADKGLEREAQAEDGRWYLVRVLPYAVAPQSFAGVVFTLIDITPLRDARERLANSLQTSADIVAHMPSGLFVYELVGEDSLRLVRGNPAACQATGLDAESCVGLDFCELWPGQEGGVLKERLLQALHSKETIHEPEFRYQDARLSGTYHIHAFPLPGQRLAVGFEDITEKKQAEQALLRLEWLLTRQPGQEPPFLSQPYGDLAELNPDGLIRNTVGPDLLTNIVSDYLDLLETSAAVYEADGAYALGIFSSGWCRFLDNAARQLCATDDNRAALTSGYWHCHESCWSEASKKAIEQGEGVDIACRGGLRIHALPIRINGRVAGSINFGYGDPPRDQDTIRELARRYGVEEAELERLAEAYETRPPFIIELAKKRLATSAQLISEISERRLAERALQESEARNRSLLRLLADAEAASHMGSWTWDVASDTVTWSDNLYRLFGRDPARGAPSFAEHDVLYTPASMKLLRQTVEQSLADGSRYELKLEAVRDDGSTFPCIARGLAEQDSQGVVQRLYGSLQELKP